MVATYCVHFMTNIRFKAIFSTVMNAHLPVAQKVDSSLEFCQFSILSMRDLLESSVFVLSQNNYEKCSANGCTATRWLHHQTCHVISLCPPSMTEPIWESTHNTHRVTFTRVNSKRPGQTKSIKLKIEVCTTNHHH